MGNKQGSKGFVGRKVKERTLDEIAGVEMFEDSQGMLWHIKVFCIGEIPTRFHAALVSLHMADIVGFIQRIVYNPDPGLWTIFRRRWGLEDYSRRYIGRHFLMKDSQKIQDRVIEVNFDMSAEEFANLSDSKKKAILGI